TKFFNDSELTQEMHERIEFYVSAVKLKPLQIQRALRREFPDHKIYLSEIHKATAKYYTLFPELDKALSLFITPEIQKIQRAEIKSCINYHASAITKDEMIKYQEPESDNTLFVEDDEDIMQISINYILENIDINEIEEIWAIHNYSQDQLTKFARSNINRLFTPMTDLRDERKENINERKLYGELWGIARNITQKAVQFHRQDVLEKLQNLLTEIQEDELVNSPANDDNDETCSNSLDSKSLDDDEECEE
ncbi:15835_t:CDS:2, partial [Cetraspora pellucida]